MAISNPARIVVGFIVIAAVVLEIVVYLAYRNTVDGQAVFANLAVLIYALVAVWIVRVADRAIRRHRHDRSPN